MSWMAKLYDTYEAGSKFDLPDKKKIMPISHTLQNAHINIVLDGKGNFKRATVLKKTQIVLPATEKSAGRSSGEAPHPLADKLQYVAKDYADFGGKKKAYFEGYRKQLSDWCESSFSHAKVQAVKDYIEKGHVIADLINGNILFADNNILLTAWPNKVTKEHPLPEIFKVLPKKKEGNAIVQEQGDALVCWSVEIEGESGSATWTDENIQESWIAFDGLKSDREGFCYIKGNMDRAIVLATNHPAKLRNTGDKAKLISSNDTSGYTFRGKFVTDDQVVGISFDATQKAHNALRWLLSRQGYRNGDQVIVAWAVSGKEIPQPMTDTWSFLGEDLLAINPKIEQKTEEPQLDHTKDMGQSFAKSLNNYMAGYRAVLKPTDSIVIMALDSATPGRMGIIYYRETYPDEFIGEIARWHEDFAWPQRHTLEVQDGKKKQKHRTVWPISAPSPKSIWEAAYGTSVKDTLKKNLIERIIPCIIEGRPISQDIVNETIRRVLNRNTYKNNEQWLWERNLGVACALYRGFCIRIPDSKKRRNYSMALEEDNKSRDYLYGRLLAIAERIEEIALSVSNENRTTTAGRLMQRFADRPYSTWRNIEIALQPYMQRLRNSRTGFLINREKQLDEIMFSFDSDNFEKDKPLSGEFLLAYHSQRLALRNTKETNTDKK